ncbi:Acetyl-coenzyme A carboxylase carboxyl transferase subunit beta 2 [Mortierella polycephala]|uniref:Acetyl-coenzyme A carboxylase carboxyl transferase subunit beta 2 n=1 Tax=Mortierella polycephala TaxID=41804 RepID=A0A9P6PKU4_9FUNG|nr:Acetyl-coenzyme A carboxylase carboxyl transferase subunit beta 2 [Mortierella polycephala]
MGGDEFSSKQPSVAPHLGHHTKPTKSKVNTKSPEYIANYKEMLEMVDQLNERLQEATFQGEDRLIALHHKRGSILARDRIELLLDDDSPFLELCPLAGYGQDDMTIGGSQVAGIGLVCGVECMVSANIPTLQGGASNATTLARGERLGRIAWENRLPHVQLVQSAGANLAQQSCVFHPGGAVFRHLVGRSKAGLPSAAVVPCITIVMGASYGAGNYAMAGRAYNPRFLFSWSKSKCSVMGAEQLTGVLDIVMRDSAKKSGRMIDEEMAKASMDMFQAMVESESDVYWTSSRCIDDGVIDPRETRTILGFCLSVCYNTEIKGGNLYGVSRM